MKRILITGKNSYIGTSFENYLSKFPSDYYIETLDMRNENWRSFDFSKFDVVFHVAGIAHIKETKKNRHLYFKVNRDLAIETAKHSKISGIKQFIFLSTMSVFGLDEGIIDENTPTLPKNAYGKSKFEAEEEIIKLNSNEFKVAIVRPPMVYGKGCKGNYLMLSRIARITPIFPNIKNQRSMIFIDNLSEFIRNTIVHNSFGYFHPQNKEYTDVCEMVCLIAKLDGKSIKTIGILNPLINKIELKLFRKVFKSLIYDFSNLGNMYVEAFTNFEESIRKTEQRN